MPSYHDAEFSESLVAEISATIGRASDEAVLKYIQKHEDLARGFQVRKSNCGAFRKRIGCYILGMRELDADSADFLYCAGIGQEFVAVLSHVALFCHLDQFAVIFGHSAFTLALLLDERVEVRSLGRRLLEGDREPFEDDRDAACRAVAENLCNFATHFYAICAGTSGSGSPAKGGDGERISGLERMLKEEQRRNGLISDRLKGDKESFQRQLSEKSKSIARLAAERNELRSTCGELRQRAESLEKEIERLRLSHASEIGAAVESRLKGITSGWLRNRIDLEEELSRADETWDLLDLANGAIARQARVDRHSGNRRELQERLNAISAKLAELRDVRANALHPIDGLTEIEIRLVVEEQHLTRLLGKEEEPPRSPLVQALAARINAAPAGEGILHLEQLLDELRQLGLSEGDFTFLQNRLGERYDRLMTEHGDRPLPQIPLNPALRFRLALGQGTPLTLVCDGHNILCSLEAFRDVRERSHSEARKSLSDSITSLLLPYGNCKATIVYDGPDHNRVPCSDNVTAIYSGGGKNERHRADRRIEEMLSWRSYTGSSGQVYVVTADSDLGREARESGAEVIPVEPFGWVLGECDW